jgi:hypothetical protein
MNRLSTLQMILFKLVTDQRLTEKEIRHVAKTAASGAINKSTFKAILDHEDKHTSITAITTGRRAGNSRLAVELTLHKVNQLLSQNQQCKDNNIVILSYTLAASTESIFTNLVNELTNQGIRCKQDTRTRTITIQNSNVNIRILATICESSALKQCRFDLVILDGIEENKLKEAYEDLSASLNPSAVGKMLILGHESGTGEWSEFYRRLPKSVLKLQMRPHILNPELDNDKDRLKMIKKLDPQSYKYAYEARLTPKKKK